MTTPLRVEISPGNVTALRAAWALRSNPLLRVSVKAIHAPHQHPLGRVLRIESGSRVEPILTLLSGVDRGAPGDDEARAARLGLNTAVYTSGRLGYEWSERGRPLPARARVGIPDAARPWVLVAPGVRTDVQTIERLTALTNPQLHFVGPAAPSLGSSAVWWLPSAMVVLSLLGRVSAVLAPPGPLAWDAARLGVPVFDPDPVPRLPASIVQRRLARVVPAKLAIDEEFWRQLGTQLARGEMTGDWSTITWLLRARERRAMSQVKRGFGAARLGNKLLKLRRDPRRFWADSLLAKHLVTRAVALPSRPGDVPSVRIVSPLE